MTEISLAWLLQKVTSPVVGATKLSHVEGAAKAVDLVLTPEETAYLEEPYLPHKLVGVWRRTLPPPRSSTSGPPADRQLSRRQKRVAFVRLCSVPSRRNGAC